MQDLIPLVSALDEPVPGTSLVYNICTSVMVVYHQCHMPLSFHQLLAGPQYCNNSNRCQLTSHSYPLHKWSTEFQQSLHSVNLSLFQNHQQDRHRHRHNCLWNIMCLIVASSCWSYVGALLSVCRNVCLPTFLPLKRCWNSTISSMVNSESRKDVTTLFSSTKSTFSSS